MTRVTSSPADSFASNKTGDHIVPFVSPIQDREAIGDFEAEGTWTVLSNDTTTLATSLEHVLGTKSLSFAKVDGAANTVVAGIQDTITSIDLSRFGPAAGIEVVMKVTSADNVAKAFVRLGTDSSNYNEWRIDDSDINEGTWTFKRILLSASESVTGDGWDPSAVTYIAVGTRHDLQDDTLAAILFDSISMIGDKTEDSAIQEVTLLQDREAVGDFEVTDTWSVLGNDTITLATSLEHVFGTSSLSFAKTDGGANTVIAGIQSTIVSVDLSRFGPAAGIEVMMQVSSVANVDKAFVRLGIDSSNYNEWQIDDSDITAGVWTFKRIPLSASGNVVGTGWDSSAVTYIAVGTIHDAEADALAAILFDSVFVIGALMTVT